MPSNCYGYALRLDISVTPGTNNEKDSVVSEWSEGLHKHPFIDRQKDVLVRECLKDGLTLQPVGQKRQIALFVDKYKTCIDYHFIRLDLNNTWSCQDSTGGPITTGIRDPIAYNKSLVGRQLFTGKLIAQMYAGLLYLPDNFNANFM